MPDHSGEFADPVGLDEQQHAAVPQRRQHAGIFVQHRGAVLNAGNGVVGMMADVENRGLFRVKAGLPG